MNNRDFIRQAPVSFTCDYNEGAHPEILRRLLETNMLQEPGYGSDRFTQSAIAKIRHAIDAAMRLQLLFRDKQIPLYIQSPTNQQFPILTQEQMKRLEGKVLYEIWERLSDGRAVTRFATSWATPAEHIQLLAEIL